MAFPCHKRLWTIQYKIYSMWKGLEDWRSHWIIFTQPFLRSNDCTKKKSVHKLEKRTTAKEMFSLISRCNQLNVCFSRGRDGYAFLPGIFFCSQMCFFFFWLTGMVSSYYGLFQPRPICLVNETILLIGNEEIEWTQS